MISNEEFQAVAGLDLEAIKMKLMHKASGEGWSQVQADTVEVEYRRFLFLMNKFPNEQTAPTVEVDTFWHYHILDTMKYAADCQQAFGYFLHHYPYVGMDGASDDQDRLSAGARMQELYSATFGDSAAHQTGTAATAWCGIAPPQKAQADSAWCGIAPPQKAQADTAWCGITQPPQKAQTDTAWCGIQPPQKAQTDTAWCGIQPPQKAQTGTAWCGIQPPQQAQAETAWCGIQPPAGAHPAITIRYSGAALAGVSKHHA